MVPARTSSEIVAVDDGAGTVDLLERALRASRRAHVMTVLESSVGLVPRLLERRAPSDDPLRHAADLVVLSIRGDATGLDVLDSIREHDSLVGTPVLVLAPADLVGEAYARGAIGVLSEPVDLNALITFCDSGEAWCSQLRFPWTRTW